MAKPATNTPLSPHRGTIALLEVDERTDRKLRDTLSAGYAFKVFDAHEPLLSAVSLGSLNIDALIIGFEAEDALDVAMQVRSQHKHLQIIVLAELREVDTLRRRAEIQRDGGDEVQVWPSQHLEELPQEIKKAIKRAHRRVRSESSSEDPAGSGGGGAAAEVTEHFDTLLEHAPIGMLTLNAAGEVLALNKQARTILAVERGQMINKPVFDFFPVFEQQKLRRSLRNRCDGSAEDATLVLRIGDASDDAESQRHVEVIVAGSVPRKGEECTMLILHDVSNIARAEIAQRRTAAALQASEDRFLELAEVMRMVPWEADPQTLRITYIGKLVEEIMGYPRSSWLGRNVWVDRLHPDDRGRAVRILSRDSRRLQNFDLQFRMHAADGSVKRLRNIVNVVRGEDGEPSKIRGFIVDVTQNTQESSDYDHSL